MRSSFALLNRQVDFSFAKEATGGDGGELIRSAWEGIQEVPSPQELRDAVTKYMGTLKAQAVIAEPPDLSRLRILAPVEYMELPPPLLDMNSGRISSADKNLVAISVGCRPGTGMREIGGYLIYDASKDSLSVVPRLLDDYFHAAIGCQSAVVVCNGDDGGFFLAELVWLRPEFSQAAIWLWNSSAPESGWSLKSARVRLPPGFCSNLCFSYRGSILCWVDLLEGIVMCDLGKDCSNSSDPELYFIPLPADCPSYDTDDNWNRYYLCPEKFRSMACVGGTIKFVTMDGSVKHVRGKEFDLTVYTLLPDLSHWEMSSKSNVENIWANQSYHSTGMPKIAPTCPVLSLHEDGVIYLVFANVRASARLEYSFRARSRLEYKGQYLVRVDVENNKVHVYPRTADCTIGFSLLGSDLRAYCQGLLDHPREIEASEMVTSGKSKKL